MRNSSLRAGLHRYKRNLLFPFFALIFVLPNLIGCTQVLPIEEEKQEINGSVKDWDSSDSTYTTKPDSVRDMTHADSIRFGLI